MHNRKLYDRLDRKHVRDEVIEIRAARNRDWRQVVLPKERSLFTCYLCNISFK